MKENIQACQFIFGYLKLDELKKAANSSFSQSLSQSPSNSEKS